MTNLNWQLLLTLAIVAGAAFYVGRAFWRSAHPKKGSCGGCGCSRTPAVQQSQSPLIDSRSITLRPARTTTERKVNQSS